MHISLENPVLPPTTSILMQHEQHRVPVTAVSVWNRDIVLSGEGTLLNAYHARGRTLLCSLAIFEDQQIHGIVTGADEKDSFALIWGNRCIRKVVIEQNTDNSIAFRPGRIYYAGDWILDVDLTPFSSGHAVRAAILTAHNALTVWELDDDGHQERLDPLVPGSNCILYSAHIQWLGVSNCLIAAGTAFGDVIIWSCLLSVRDGKLEAQSQTHFTFSAHEGSVFGVHLSSNEVAAALDGRKHVLASCSDDRTIKLWDVSDLSVQSPNLNDVQRDTGFGAKQIEDRYAAPCLGKAMAHVSRIWHVRLTFNKDIREQGPGQVLLWSFGEDASYIFWRLHPGGSAVGATPYIITQCRMRKYHSGKNIWSLAFAGPYNVVTGGADGAIVLSGLAQDAIHQENDWHVSEISFPAASNSEPSEKFKAYVFTGLDELVASTDQGRITLLRLGDAKDHTSSEISPPINGLRGYSLLSGCSGIAFAAGIDGAVYACLPVTKSVTEILQTGKKVTALFSTPLENAQGIVQDIIVLTTNINADHATCTVLALSTGDTGFGCLTQVGQYELQLESSFVVTSFGAWRSGGHIHVVLGSRHGDIALYDITDEQKSPVSTKALISGSHCNEAITSLAFVTHSTSDADPVSLLSAGRDGTYAVHFLRFEEHCIQLETVHQLSLPFGPNIEGFGFSTAGDLWVWGFRSTHFVVFNVRTQQEIFIVECGGAHRSWEFQMHKNGGLFVWTKASKLFYERETETSVIIRPSEHGRDIKTMSVSPTLPHIIATGSEDTNIKLNTYDTGGFHGLHTLRMHDTGIQHLQWSTDGIYLFSSGGFEELLVWRVTPGVPKIGVGVTCESKHPNSGRSDLRMTTFHAQRSEQDPRAFYITALYSDSSIKHWQYGSLTKSWTLLASGEYLTACPTQCLHLEPSPGFLSASTDGHLTTWSRPTELHMAWESRQQTHQNGILSLVGHELADGSSLVFSGGDDNALAIARYAADSRSPAAVLVIPQAHAAAITGLAVLPDKQRTDVLWLVSASIDQRLKLWWLSIDIKRAGVQGLEIQRRANVFTSVADVSGLERIPLGDGNAEGVLVVGVGMDVWRLTCLEN